MKTKVNDDFRNNLMEHAAWDKVGIKPSGSSDMLEESTEDGAPAEETQFETATCPLCESELDEDLSEESISEHLDTVLGMVEEAVEEQEYNEFLFSMNEEELEEYVDGLDEESLGLFENYLEYLEGDILEEEYLDEDGMNGDNFHTSPEKNPRGPNAPLKQKKSVK